jgi:hypothetical protein
MELERNMNREQRIAVDLIKKRSKTVDRISYEAEVDVIRQQIGDLEDIRFRLGLSARKMAQLLLVDPSAWSRWTQKITPPPPHIFRALQWYLALQEKNPGFTPQVFLANHWYSTQKQHQSETEKMRLEMDHLRTLLKTLETQSQKESLSSPFKRNIRFFLGGLFVGVLLSWSLR